MKTLRRNMDGIAIWAILGALVGWMLNTPPIRATEDSRVDKQLLNAQSGLNTAVVSTATDQLRCRESAVYIIWGAGTSAGAVTIETADNDAYAGVWAALSTVPWTAVSKEDVVQITGIHKSIRTRISTAIVGGTVSTWIVCN